MDSARVTPSSSLQVTATKSPSTPSSTQQTIPSCFNNLEQDSPNGSYGSSFSKRRKLNSPHDARTSPRAALSVAEMYSFPSSSLSSSHGNSPTAPHSLSQHRRTSSGHTHVERPVQIKGPKKLIIKNLRTTTRNSPEEYQAKTVAQLRSALDAIFDHQKPPVSNEELYRSSENLCRLGKGAELAKLLFDRCKEHVGGQVKARLHEQAASKNAQVLRSVRSAWVAWSEQILTIRGIFFYLDRAYLLQKRLDSIHETTTVQFRRFILNDAILRPKIIDGACDLILADREGVSQEPELFKDAIKMFQETGVYTNEFEPRMLELSQAYIARWSDQEGIELPLPEFVTATVKFIERETSRCDAFELDKTTSRALLTLLEHHCIERREAELLNADGIADLLDANEQDILEKLYSLLKRRRLETKLRDPFGRWILDTGSAIVFDEEHQDTMVKSLLELKTKLDHTWVFAFHKHEELSHTLRESFEAFINKTKKSNATWGTDNSKPGEMIAKYVDALLRSGARAISKQLGVPSSTIQVNEDENEDAYDEDSAVDSQLDQVLDLFRFVHGKSVFEAFYKKDLARRLLMGRSASNDAERSMLARLKAECGASFTSNLEQMFKDIELSREEMSAYKARTQYLEKESKVDLTVNILSAAAWPGYPDNPVIIPPEINEVIDEFEKYYNLKHSGRKLQWKHALAHCQLTGRFPKGDKEVVVSSFQAVVLLLFNKLGPDEHISYEQIKAESGLTHPEAKRTLQSLACAKLRPLTKHPRGRDVNETDTFTLNNSFSHDRYRVKINAIQLKETKEENQETHERVAADRQYETQAAIVRIMKSRRTIGHSELVAEVISATKNRGVLSVADIKKNIDKLIEKEYMERMEGNTYEYLA